MKKAAGESTEKTEGQQTDETHKRNMSPDKKNYQITFVDPPANSSESTSPIPSVGVQPSEKSANQPKVESSKDHQK